MKTKKVILIILVLMLVLTSVVVTTDPVYAEADIDCSKYESEYWYFWMEQYFQQEQPENMIIAIGCIRDLNSRPNLQSWDLAKAYYMLGDTTTALNVIPVELSYGVPDYDECRLGYDAGVDSSEACLEAISYIEGLIAGNGQDGTDDVTYNLLAGAYYYLSINQGRNGEYTEAVETLVVSHYYIGLPDVHFAQFLYLAGEYDHVAEVLSSEYFELTDDQINLVAAHSLMAVMYATQGEFGLSRSHLNQLLAYQAYRCDLPDYIYNVNSMTAALTIGYDNFIPDPNGGCIEIGYYAEALFNADKVEEAYGLLEGYNPERSLSIQYAEEAAEYIGYTTRAEDFAQMGLESWLAYVSERFGISEDPIESQRQ